MNTNRTIRTVWFTAGILSLGFGFAGSVLPILPTTPFILLSVYAFAQSSPRLHDWLISHSQFGPLIYNWREYGAIDRRTKLISLAIMALTPLVTWFIGAPYWILILQVVVLTLSATFIVTRPDAKPIDKNANQGLSDK